MSSISKKENLPAMPFYWGDWFKAADVQMLPRDIRCTWFEMLGRMWESKKRGYLCYNNITPTVTELAQLLGFGSDVKTCEEHINYLEARGIFSRENGVIVSRRMANDAELSRKRSESGKEGMKSRYKKIDKSDACYNKGDNKVLTNTEYETEDVIESVGIIKTKEENFKKIPPTLEEIITRGKALDYQEIEIQADRFFNYYESNGWKVGKNPMKNWSAALTNWYKNIKQFNNESSNGNRNGWGKHGSDDSRHKAGQSSQDTVIAGSVYRE